MESTAEIHQQLLDAIELSPKYARITHIGPMPPMDLSDEVEEPEPTPDPAVMVPGTRLLSNFSRFAADPASGAYLEVDGCLACFLTGEGDVTPLAESDLHSPPKISVTVAKRFITPERVAKIAAEVRAKRAEDAPHSFGPRAVFVEGGR